MSAEPDERGQPEVDRRPARPVAEEPTGRLPDFLIIGAAKCGTTMLFHALSQHPRIFTPRLKEPGFFADDQVYRRGLGWYRQLFSGASAEQLCGEASTQYTRYPQLPHTAGRMADAVPGAKLIYLVRHPVDRAYSHYVHRVTKELYPGQPIPWDFETHVERDPMCLDSSRYMSQLDQYLRHYEPGSILVMLQERMREDLAATVRRVFAFLGVDEHAEIEAVPPRKSNETARYLRRQGEAQVRDRIARLPGAERVARAVPKSVRQRLLRVVSRSPYGERVQRQYNPPPMRPETRRRLVEWYRPEIERLERFTGYDLSHWKS